MTNPIAALFKELWSNRVRDRDKERLESMQSNNRALAANNKELAATASRIESNNKERLQMMQSTASALKSNNKELKSTASALELTASALESNNKELTSAVLRMELALKLRKEKLNKAMPNPDRYFNVCMSPELAEQFNELAEQNEMSRAEVFRRAISLYKLAKIAQINGEEIIIRSGTTERHFIDI